MNRDLNRDPNRDLKLGLKRSLLAAGLAAGLMGGVFAVSSPLLAEDRPFPRDFAAQQDKGGKGGNPGLKLAQRLSVQETWIGITPEQAPVWRAYTEAVLAFAGADHGKPGQHPPAPPAAAPSGSGPGGDAPPRLLMAEIMAEHALAKSGKAEALKQAATDLRATLSEAQLERLLEAEAPPAPPRGGREAPPPVPQPPAD